MIQRLLAIYVVFYFRSTILQEMNLDMDTLKSFTLNAVDLQFTKGAASFLVVLHKCNLLSVLSASSTSSVGETKSFMRSMSSFVGWKLFSQKDATDKFITRLKEVVDIRVDDNGTNTDTEAERRQPVLDS